jgi:hypothetical protein
VILPTKAANAAAQGQGRAQGSDYAQDNALKGRTFTSLADQNRHLLDWETSRRRHPHPRHHPSSRSEGFER